MRVFSLLYHPFEYAKRLKSDRYTLLGRKASFVLESITPYQISDYEHVYFQDVFFSY